MVHQVHYVHEFNHGTPYLSFPETLTNPQEAAPAVEPALSAAEAYGTAGIGIAALVISLFLLGAGRKKTRRYTRSGRVKT